MGSGADKDWNELERLEGEFPNIKEVAALDRQVDGNH